MIFKSNFYDMNQPWWCSGGSHVGTVMFVLICMQYCMQLIFIIISCFWFVVLRPCQRSVDDGRAAHPRRLRRHKGGTTQLRQFSKTFSSVCKVPPTAPMSCVVFTYFKLVCFVMALVNIIFNFCCYFPFWGEWRGGGEPPHRRHLWPGGSAQWRAGGWARSGASPADFWRLRPEVPAAARRATRSGTTNTLTFFFSQWKFKSIFTKDSEIRCGNMCAVYHVFEKHMFVLCLFPRPLAQKVTR